MNCTKCNVGEFRLNPAAKIVQVFRGETLMVTSPVMECSGCGLQILCEGQLDELCQRTMRAFLDLRPSIRKRWFGQLGAA